MNLPTQQQAEQLLREAGRLNPGNWVEHSLVAATLPGLNTDTAYICGLLHDIGRREGRTYMRHSLDGYRFLHSLGHETAAKICVTHTFWQHTIDDYPGQWDCSRAEQDFLRSYLQALDYDDYDYLIQLCDCLALPSGFCLLEQRLVDVAIRYGTTPHTAEKWRRLFAYKAKLEQIIGHSIYTLLPGVVENTFRDSLSQSGEITAKHCPGIVGK